jgi:glycine cleavage system H protein
MTGARFTRDHHWVHMQGGVATVGITEFAQETLGAVTLVRLPQPGSRVLAGGACAVIETVKAASDADAPLDGRVIEINAAVLDAPALVNQDAEGAGWLYRMAPDDAAALDALMDRAAYDALLDAMQSAPIR